MTYIVTDACIKCKYTDCVEVCPVDCFYEGENMLVIHPDECIDCGVCEPECPAEAIKADTESNLEKWLELNTKFSDSWPNITIKKDAPADADDFLIKEGNLMLISPKRLEKATKTRFCVPPEPAFEPRIEFYQIYVIILLTKPRITMLIRRVFGGFFRSNIPEFIFGFLNVDGAL